MGFRETGYFFFLMIVFFNIGLSFFVPGGTTSSYLTEHAGPGLDSVGDVRLEEIPNGTTQGSTFVATQSVTETSQSTSQANKVSNDLFPDVFGLINDLLFSGANAIETSGLPSPLNWIFAFIIKIIVTSWLFVFGLDIINAIRGGGSVQ